MSAIYKLAKMDGWATKEQIAEQERELEAANQEAKLMGSGTDTTHQTKFNASFIAVNPEVAAGQAQIVPSPNPIGAVKADTGKPPLSMIPRCALEYEAAALGFGAKKYAKNNFKGGMEWSRMADAAMRHIAAWADGEENDPESGLSHLAHARASLGMLVYHVEKKVGKDDR